MSSDLPRRNRFSLFRAKRPFFRSLRPALCRRPRPLFRPTRAFVINYITATRGIALPHISLYISLYISIPCIYHRYRVLPSALLLFDHAAIIFSPPRAFSHYPRMLFFPCEDVALPRAITFALPRAVSCLTGQDLDHRIHACLPHAKSFCAPDRRASLFSAPTVKLSAQRRTLAALPRVNVTHKTSLRATARPVTARINAHMIKYDDFVKIFIIIY